MTKASWRLFYIGVHENSRGTCDALGVYFRCSPEHYGIPERNTHVRVSVGVYERIDSGVQVAEPHADVDTRYASVTEPYVDGVRDLERNPGYDEGANDYPELGCRFDFFA